MSMAINCLRKPMISRLERRMVSPIRFATSNVLAALLYQRGAPKDGFREPAKSNRSDTAVGFNRAILGAIDAPNEWPTNTHFLSG